MQRLTLRLTRTEDYKDFESRTISVDLPIDATESDLRLAFHYVEDVIVETRERMDAAAELVDSIITSREAIEKQAPVGIDDDPSSTGSVASANFEGTVTMEEQRAATAAEQASRVATADASVSS